MLLKMAFQNVFRNTRRTLLTSSAIFLGILILLVVSSWNEGYKAQYQNLFVRTNTGAMKIVAPEYTLDELTNPIDYPLNDYQNVVGYLEQQRNISFEPRIQFHGTLNNGVDEVGALGLGIDPNKEEVLFKRSQDMVAGRFIQPGDQEGIVLGYNLAKVLNVGVGDIITVVAKATQMGFNAYDLEIIGLIGTGNPAVDYNAFFIPFQFAQNFLTINGITEIAIQVTDETKIDSFYNTLRGQSFRNKVTVYTWRDFAKNMLNYIEYRQKIINFLTGIILIMAAAGILNTMLMAMLERKKEIGILMSMGVTKGGILRLFLLEGIIVGVLGSLSAVALGALLVAIFHQQGLPISIGTYGNEPVWGKMYPFLGLATFLGLFALGIILAILATIYPALKSSRVQPVEAISGIRRK